MGQAIFDNLTLFAEKNPKNLCPMDLARNNYDTPHTLNFSNKDLSSLFGVEIRFVKELNCSQRK